MNLKSDSAGSTGDNAASAEGAAFRISSRPVVEDGSVQSASEPRSALPRSYGTEKLCLMARDPHTLLAYWDIDWSAAFHERPPRGQKVYLRVLSPGGSEPHTVEVEPMAGSCYVAVSEADVAYTAEIGSYNPPGTWNSLATSNIISTPPDMIAGSDASAFATVPFHLTFQHMIDTLRVSKQDNESLTAMLAELREHARSAQTSSALTAQQRELANMLDEVQFWAPVSSGRNDGVSGAAWTQQRLERLLGFGTSSSSGGFDGSSRAL